MNRAVLLLGSNKGDSASTLKKAVTELSKLADPLSKISLSSCYESEPWGFDAECWFLNMAVIVDTPLSARELLEKILEIETNLGRSREKTQNGNFTEVRSTYSSREIDIDIIFFNNQIINEESLIIPHPRMHLRRFVLEPIAQIAPEYLHPIFNISVQSLIESCKDTYVVKKLQDLQ